jgi:hypothetical protein
MVRQWHICGFRSNFDNCAELEKLKIPVPKNLENTVAYLAIREKARKTVQQGQVARQISTTGRANTKQQNK